MIKVNQEIRDALHFMGLIDEEVLYVWTYNGQPIYYETMDHELIKVKTEEEGNDND